MGEIATSPRDVAATMKYVVRGEKATFHAGDRAKSYWPGEEHEVVIHDMRAIADRLSFDRNGFVLLEEPSAIRNFSAKENIDAYCREVEALVQRLTGSLKTVSFGPIVRTSAQGTHGHNQPAFGAHVDYGDRTVRDFTYDLLPKDEAERLLEGRYMLINVWRPIVPVESAPFALCDASTVQREDLFDSEVVGGLGDYNRSSLWGYNLAYSPDHKWYWVPDMRPEQVLVFKLFDSDPDAVQHTAHSAFELRDAPADAAPRQSIELRTISYLG
ncbi:MAG TPA: CmcJ/NvfI family oxidoreductase [Sphingomonadaceae bacterium]|nr:CmcJ/NvfI family oxidoreductase [Sphingomonadaceae bacterium]